MSVNRSAVVDAINYAREFLAYQQWYMPFVGAQVAVRYERELLMNEAFGYRDLDADVPLTVDDLFRIASHSKTFTGVACQQLLAKGKLRLDDAASVHVPELADSTMGKVTVRELLGHTSGMTRDGRDCTFWALEKTFPDRDELLVTVQNEGFVLPPNEHFKYSNIGYSLLGLIIERASGESYRDFVTRTIVEPLGLTKTGPDLDFDRLDQFAKGYTSKAHGWNRREIEHIDTYAESSATGFFSTAEELSAYFEAHLDGDERLMDDDAKRRMRQVHWTVTEDSSYGLGLSITKVNGTTYYGHSGGYPGHITISKFDPSRKLVISVLTNSNDGPAQQLCVAMLHLIDLALKDKAITDRQPAEALAPYTGRFTTLWGITDVVDLGGRLYCLSPSLINPAAESIEMEVVSPTELKAVGDRGFGGYGENMVYVRDADGNITEVWGASGMKLLPAAEYELPDKLTRPVPAAAS
jgi:CubicO group peptidase (beta-lactamase class C family)